MNIKLIYPIALVILTSFVMQWWQSDFIYIRDLIVLGEYWRIITSQMVHTNWVHYLLNMGGLWLVSALFYNTLTARTFTISLCFLLLSVGISLHLCVPSLHWYAGFSGALYGTYVIAAYSAIQKKDHFIGVSVGVLTIGKVVTDYYFGVTLDSNSLIEARVATEAHSLGVISALTLIVLDRVYQRIKHNQDQ